MSSKDRKEPPAPRKPAELPAAPVTWRFTDWAVI